MRDVTGLTGTSIKYKSIPYGIIKAWAISTAGGGFDSDSELQVRKAGILVLLCVRASDSAYSSVGQIEGACRLRVSSPGAM